FEEGINKRDLSVLTELYSDCVYHSPITGTLTGEALMRFVVSAGTAFPDGQRVVEDQLVDNYRVVTRWSYTGTHEAEFMGIAPTGRRVTVTGICINRIADGKIAEEWAEWDTFGLMQQRGAIPKSRAGKRAIDFPSLN